MNKQNIEQINVSNVPPHIAAAYELRNKGEVKKALAQAFECEKKEPNNSTVKFLLGVLHLEGKNYKAAQQYFIQCIQLVPNNENYHYYLAKLYNQTKNHDAEYNQLAKCLQINPRHLLAKTDLAINFIARGNERQGIKILNTCITQNELILPHIILAETYHRLNRFELAIQYFTQTLKIAPDNIRALNGMGITLMGLGYHLKALAYFKKTLKIDSNNVKALSNSATCYIILHDIPSALKYAQQALELKKDDSMLWRNFVLYNQYDDPKHPHIDELKNLLKIANLNDFDKANYCFALGSICEKLKNHKDAFKYFSDANKLISKNTPPEDYAFKYYQANQIKEIFNTKEIKQKVRFDKSSKIPIIILGLPCSGKSLLEQLLSQHESIGGLDEFGLYKAIQQLSQDVRPQGAFPQWFINAPETLLQSIREKYIEHYSESAQSNAQFICDTIPHNYIYAGLIAKLFPEAKFIYVKRDKFDLCMSMHNKAFVNINLKAADAPSLVSEYHEYENLMKHWLKVLKKNIIEIDYESLINKKKTTLKSIGRFLDIDLSNINTDFVNNKYTNHYQPYEAFFGELKQTFKNHNEPEPLDSSLAQPKLNNILINQAWTAYKTIEDTLATKCCEKILETEPKHSQTNYLLGMLYKDAGKADKAIELFTVSIKNNEQNIPAYDELCNLLKQQKRQMEAEYWFGHKLVMQEKMHIESNKILKKAEHDLLLSALDNNKCTFIKQANKNILLEGSLPKDQKSSSYITRSWDRYFNDLSHGSFRTYNTEFMNPWRMRTWHYLYKNQAIINHIYKNPNKLINILDIGCSSGYLRRFLEGNFNPFEKKQIYYWGVDIREHMLQEAVENINNIESGAGGIYIPSCFVAQDITKGLPFHSDTFDYVVNFEMIKYLPVDEILKLLQEILRTLKPGGFLYLSTSFSENHKGYVESMGKAALENTIKQAGFKIKQIYGSQISLREIAPHIKPEHVAMVKQLMQYHPEEMVVAMIAPFYPEFASQVTYYLQKSN